MLAALSTIPISGMAISPAADIGQEGMRKNNAAAAGSQAFGG
jgi:hypothetical protein